MNVYCIFSTKCWASGQVAGVKQFLAFQLNTASIYPDKQGFKRILGSRIFLGSLWVIWLLSVRRAHNLPGQDDRRDGKGQLFLRAKKTLQTDNESL